MTRTWRDVLTFDATWTAAGLARATAAVEKASPHLALERVPVTVTVSWAAFDAGQELANARAFTDRVELNTLSLDQANSTWEESLIHELVHIVDKQVLPQSARDAVMAMAKGCRATDVTGKCTDPVTPVWWDSPTYSERVGELFAEVSARFIWYGDADDTGEWGVYTFTPGSAAAIAAHILDTAPAPSSAPEPSPAPAPAPTPTGAHVTLPGIDVSGVWSNGQPSYRLHQSPVDVSRMVASGEARFVLVKATEGMRTSGARRLELLTAARKADALVGHYHYAWAGNDGAAEANRFLDLARPLPGEVLALDLEEGKDGASWRKRLTYALTWLRAARDQTGAAPLLYVNASWAHELRSVASPAEWAQLTSYPLWLATPSDPAGQPRDVGWPVWTMHQHSIAGGVDRDVFNGDATTWHALAVPGAKPVHADTAPAPHIPTSTGDPMVRSLTVPVVFTGEDTATADITFDGFRGTPEVLVTPGTPNYKAASYARSATRATIAVKCDWPSTSTVFCSVLVVGEPA